MITSIKIGEINEAIEKTERIRSEFFSIFQVHLGLFLGVLLGVSGGVLGNFIYNFLEKDNFAYWLLFIIISILFLLIFTKSSLDIKKVHKLYEENHNTFKELVKLKENIEEVLSKK